MVGPPMSIFSMSSSRCGAGARGNRFERVQIHHHHIDGGDAVIGERLHVAGLAAHGEDAAGDLGVHGLDATVKHLGEAGDVGDVPHRHSGFADLARGAAGGDQFGAQLMQLAGEINDAGLVSHADQDTLDFAHHLEGSTGARQARAGMGSGRGGAGVVPGGRYRPPGDLDPARTPRGLPY